MKAEAIAGQREETPPKVKVAAGQRHKVLLIQGGTILALVLAWEVVGRANPSLSMFFPSIQKIALSGWSLVTSGTLNIHVATTAYEVLWGFGLGAGLGILLGIFLGSSKTAGGIFEPYIYYVAAVPKIILYPIFILILGIGINSKIGVGAVSAFFPIVINTLAGVKEVPPPYIKAARTLGANTFQLYTQVYLPVVIGPIIAGARVGMGVALIGTMLAESKVAKAGLGYMAIEKYNTLMLSGMYAIIVLIFMASMVLNWLMSLVYARVTRYRGSSPH